MHFKLVVVEEKAEKSLGFRVKAENIQGFLTLLKLSVSRRFNSRRGLVQYSTYILWIILDADRRQQGWLFAVTAPASTGLDQPALVMVQK